MLVDSHCHLDFDGLTDDLDGVLERARAAGVGTVLTIATRVSRVERVLELADRDPAIWVAVGVHPHYVGEEGVMPVERLVELSRHPKVIGIGETGLDYHYDRSPREAQRESFRNHIRAAREAGLPFIVHARDADDDTVAILREEVDEGGSGGVMHCFSSGANLARTALDLGLHVSAAGIITFRTAENLREIFAAAPLDRLLVETDAPYLAPVPKRGKPNEPAYVAHTAACLAKVTGVTVAEIERATTDNFFRLFTKAERPG